MINLNQHLFWDVNFKLLDWRKDIDFIIGRVLLSGDIGDFKKIQKKYGSKKIKEVAQNTNCFDKKSLNFWGVIFNLPPDSFKCIKRLSVQKPNVFWRR